jgi:hypothetical protein
VTDLAASRRIGGKPADRRQTGGSAVNRRIGGKPAAADNLTAVLQPPTLPISALLTYCMSIKISVSFTNDFMKEKNILRCVIFFTAILQCTVHLVRWWRYEKICRIS